MTLEKLLRCDKLMGVKVEQVKCPKCKGHAIQYFEPYAYIICNKCGSFKLKQKETLDEVPIIREERGRDKEAEIGKKE